MKIFDEQFKELETIIEEVLKKRDRIIPIIGDNCYVGVLKDDNEKDIIVPLQEWLVETMLENDVDSVSKKRMSLRGFQGLDLFCKEFGKLYESHYGYFAESYYTSTMNKCVEEGYKNKQIFLRQDVKDFLVAGSFEVVVTTSPFHILEQEISNGFMSYNVDSYAPVKSQNAASSKVSKSEEVLKIPTVYQIFGDCNGDFVLGEDDLLKFLHYLNRTDFEKGYGASPLVKYIKDKASDNKGKCLFMPIGCDNLPNWLFRFLWYPFSSECLDGKDESNEGGIWHKHSSDDAFYKFLRDYRFKTFSKPTESLNKEGGQGDPVLIRLTKELNSKKANLEKYASVELKVQWNDYDMWDIFLSYASEDIEIAQRIYEILATRCGKRVWMDKRGRIKPGDKYWEAIQHGISHSKTCIFLITETYLSKAIEKNHRDENGIVEPTGVYQEIDFIKQFFLAERKDGKAWSYSIPLIMEGTKVSFTDHDNKKHNDEYLTGALLEKLPKFPEYQMLQTDALFEGVEALQINLNDLEDNLINHF